MQATLHRVDCSFCGPRDGDDGPADHSRVPHSRTPVCAVSAELPKQADTGKNHDAARVLGR